MAARMRTTRNKATVQSPSGFAIATHFPALHFRHLFYIMHSAGNTYHTGGVLWFLLAQETGRKYDFLTLGLSGQEDGFSHRRLSGEGK